MPLYTLPHGETKICNYCPAACSKSTVAGHGNLYYHFAFCSYISCFGSLRSLISVLYACVHLRVTTLCRSATCMTNPRAEIVVRSIIDCHGGSENRRGTLWYLTSTRRSTARRLMTSPRLNSPSAVNYVSCRYRFVAERRVSTALDTPRSNPPHPLAGARRVRDRPHSAGVLTGSCSISRATRDGGGRKSVDGRGN